MLNLISSVVKTFINVILTLLSFCKGPILIGLLIGGAILTFSAEASAATITQCNWVACPIWEGIESRFQNMIICFAIAILLGFLLYLLEE